ncbi:hypothetical protein CEE37_03045 [candidate division LCP-89 bacterium B3_LCP]|uniref:Glycosyl transferase family 1 n=1 Tax=candidate division LCP-89 bacterium B3_LCP TaxID=2012998 RepID=A0A532V2W8_UNCL8|nr:MAG: hypothetical protein CEE37_03045 [candidate division LCP-89 bacterium B3_LCP]
MKIVFISPTFPLRGGIARYGTYLLNALKERHNCLGIGFKKLYPSLLFPGKSQLERSAIPTDGTEVLRILHYGRPGTWIKAFREIKNFQPDCVIITWWVPFWAIHLGWLARALAPICPVIFLCHNVLPHEQRRFDAKLIHWALRPGHGYIVHSEDNRSQLLDWFPQAKVIRREHPIYELVGQRGLSREKARKSLKISGRMLLFFGLIRPYKGLDVAIEAFSELGPQYNDLKLWVAGEFWEDGARYRSLIEKYGLQNRVIIEPGYFSDEDLAERICASDGVILPYKSATGSGVLANAFAMDRPVIATRVGCFKEMVQPDVNGVLCEPDNAESLATAIEDFFSGEGPGRFDEGIQEAKNKFTWDAIVDAAMELTGHG